MSDALIIISVIIVNDAIIAAIFWYGGFKRGQIDALSGKQKYKLIEFPNGKRDFYNDPKPSDFSKDYQDFKVIK